MTTVIVRYTIHLHSYVSAGGCGSIAVKPIGWDVVCHDGGLRGAGNVEVWSTNSSSAAVARVD